MIRGEFGSMGRPVVEGYLRLPRFDIARVITFLVDTGADTTCIHPKDGRLAGIPFDLLEHAVTSIGRDIIDRWRMLYDRTDNLLEFTVKR